MGKDGFDMSNNPEYWKILKDGALVLTLVNLASMIFLYIEMSSYLFWECFDSRSI